MRPLPSELATPPVTKMCFGMGLDLRQTTRTFERGCTTGSHHTRDAGLRSRGSRGSARHRAGAARRRARRAASSGRSRTACGPARRPAARRRAAPTEANVVPVARPPSTRRTCVSRQRRDLGRWVTTSTWWSAAERGERRADGDRRGAADAGVDLVEHQRRRRRLVRPTLDAARGAAPASPGPARRPTRPG